MAARRRDLDPDTAAGARTRSEYLLLARALIAHGRAAQAQPLLAQLCLRRSGRSSGDGARGAVLQAVARHLEGSTQQAHEKCTARSARDEGWVRVFVDLGPWPTSSPPGRTAADAGGEVVEGLLVAFGEAPPAQATASAVRPLAEPIHEREAARPALHRGGECRTRRSRHSCTCRRTP